VTPSDEILMAYADGELDEAGRMEVEAAMARDPEVAAIVARHRELHRRLRAAFDAELTEPLPERLLEAVRNSGPATADVSPRVVDLAQARDAKAGRAARRWGPREWSAMAACIVAGLLIARVIPIGGGGGALFASRDGELVARGALAQALTELPSGQADPRGDIVVSFSFRATSGEYCRAFMARDERALAGLACREADGDGWRLRVLAEGAQPAGSPDGYRMAGAELPPAVTAAVEGAIDGETLDPAAERRAIDAGWRAQ
jgi:anti-sigma factor RsiW